MSCKIYNRGNMVVLVDTDYKANNTKTSRWRTQTIPRDRVWYEYDPTEAPILYSLYYDNPERDLFLDKQYTFFLKEDGTGFTDDTELQKYLDIVLGSVSGESVVSAGNSSTTLLTAASIFTGEWEDVLNYHSLIVSVKTDQNGTFQVQYSPDGINIDSTLTRYYRTSQIEPPHRFTNTRRYCRVIFTNTSASDQTFFRMQTIYGQRSDLNIPLDSTISQDYDSISVRPTDYTTEVALGRRQSASTWNKFGYNEDVDSGTEIVAEFGSVFNQKLTTARTLSIVSTSTNDTNTAGTGARQLLVYGVDANWVEQIEIVSLNGTTPVVTTNTWLGVNRIAIYLAGTLQSNEGKITATATTDLNIMATIPAGQGTTQQCIFYVPADTSFLVTWIFLTGLKTSGGGNPVVLFKGWVFSNISNSKYEIFRYTLDTQTSDHIELRPREPFIVGEKSIIYFEATVTVNDVSCAGRFSGKLIKEIDHV